MKLGVLVGVFFFVQAVVGDDVGNCCRQAVLGAGSNIYCRRVQYRLTGVESTIRLLQDLVTELRTTVKNIETENAALKAKLPDICTKTSIGKQRAVGFHVAFTTPSLNAPKIIPFDKILYNSGNGWNKSTYKFVAPVRGLYSFTLTVLNQLKNSLSASIKIQGRKIQSAYAVGGHHGNSGTASVVVELNKNQDVSASADSGQMHGNHWTHFVGFLIHAV